MFYIPRYQITTLLLKMCILVKSCMQAMVGELQHKTWITISFQCAILCTVSNNSVQSLMQKSIHAGMDLKRFGNKAGMKVPEVCSTMERWEKRKTRRLLYKLLNCTFHCSNNTKYIWNECSIVFWFSFPPSSFHSIIVSLSFHLCLVQNLFQVHPYKKVFLLKTFPSMYVRTMAT